MGMQKIWSMMVFFYLKGTIYFKGICGVPHFERCVFLSPSTDFSESERP